MRRIILLAAAVALAAGPAALAQDVKPGSPAANEAQVETAKTPDQALPRPSNATDAAARPGDATAPVADEGPKPPNPDPDGKGVPPPDAAAQKAAYEKAVKAAKPPPRKPSLAEAGGATVGGILASAAGTAAGGPLGGAAAGFVGNMIGGGIVRTISKVFSHGKKKDAGEQQAAAASGQGADASVTSAESPK